MMEQNLFQQDMLERKNALVSRENETYAKIELLYGGHEKQIVYVKGTWYPTHFMMFVLDGEDTWNFNGNCKFILKKK